MTGACAIELQEVLASLRTLMPEALRMMVANFNRRTAGRFKTPMFAHSELDLARAFWAVQDKGGYDAVCAGKLWKVGMDGGLAVWQLKAQSGQVLGGTSVLLQLHVCFQQPRVRTGEE